MSTSLASADTRNWLDRLLAGATPVAADAKDWGNDFRQRSLEQAHALALPGRRDEDWRFTDLSSLYRLAFSSGVQAPAVREDLLEALHIPEAAARLVFVDGVLLDALSDIAALPGVELAPIGQVLAEPAHPLRALLESRLGQMVEADRHAFAAINGSFLGTGAVLRVSAGAALAGPIHLLHISTRSGLATHPRLLVEIERSAQAWLIEDHVALGGDAALGNAVAEIRVGQGASLRHARLQRAAPTSFHLERCVVEVARDARYDSVSIALGARLSRLDLAVRLAGQGAHASLDGLAMVGDAQLADTHSFIDHATPNGSSRQLHKMVLAGNGHGVFNGRILVEAGAQQTDSAQQSRALILSDRARVDAKPQLEIHADDVKCAHGATVGQIEADELFYLVSRGIDAVRARNLLTYGFAADVVARLGVPSLEDSLRQVILERTTTGGSLA
jgi:Fe-S cluster assembly protein SufD